jgi:hypothetical protein
MRKAQKDGTGISHKPPSNLSADGMDAWYLQQKQRELEMRKRRQEAEALLRGYRMAALPRGTTLKTFGSPMSAVSEALDDPDCNSVYSSAPRRHTIHAGDMPQHLLPPLSVSSKRGLISEFDNESDAGCDLKTPTRNGSYMQGNSSYSGGVVFAAIEELEEKKTENDHVKYQGRHSLPGRHIMDTPHPMEEKMHNNGLLPETIWRDFISNGKLYESNTMPGKSMEEINLSQIRFFLILQNLEQNSVLRKEGITSTPRMRALVLTEL